MLTGLYRCPPTAILRCAIWHQTSRIVRGLPSCPLTMSCCRMHRPGLVICNTQIAPDPKHRLADPETMKTGLVSSEMIVCWMASHQRLCTSCSAHTSVSVSISFFLSDVDAEEDPDSAVVQTASRLLEQGSMDVLIAQLDSALVASSPDLSSNSKQEDRTSNMLVPAASALTTTTQIWQGMFWHSHRHGSLLRACTEQ